MIYVNPSPTTQIDAAATEAMTVAQEHGEAVCLLFNGIPILVRPDDTHSQVVATWDEVRRLDAEKRENEEFDAQLTPINARLAEIDSGEFREHGTPEQIAALWTAFAKAQGAFPEIRKDRMGQIGHQKFPYATLANITNTTREALSSNGLALCWPVGITGSTLHVTAIMTHCEGGRVTASATIEKPGDIKVAGAARTYLSRYLVSGLLGVDSDADADDLGKADPGKEPERKPDPKPELPARVDELPAEPEGPPRSEEQASQLKELRDGLGLTSKHLAGILRDKAGKTLDDLRKAGGSALCDELLKELRGMKDALS